jgi:hypothetical protein
LGTSQQLAVGIDDVKQLCAFDPEAVMRDGAKQAATRIRRKGPTAPLARWRPAVASVVVFGTLTSIGYWLLRVDVRPAILGDGIGYYAPLASLLFQGNLDLRDEIIPHVSTPVLKAIYVTPEGRLGNPFSVGPSLLWAPAVALAKLAPDHGAEGSPALRTSHVAFAPRYARAIFYTDLVVVVAASAALSAVLSLIVGAGPAGVAVAAVLFGTPAVAYVLFDPSYSHAASFAMACILVSVVLLDRRRSLPLAVLGTSVGLAAMMRWQDVVLACAFLPRLVAVYRCCTEAGAGNRWRCRLRAGLRFGLPIVVLFVPQFAYWWIIYGHPVLVPPGPDFAPPWRVAILPLLFSTWNGAFVWSPILLVGIAGFFSVQDRRFRLGLFAAVLLQAGVCALLLDWWAGGSFGARRMVSVAPLAAYGLALLFMRWRRRRVRMLLLAVFTAVACWWNVTLCVSQRYGALPWNPGHQPDYNRYHVPGPHRTDRYGLWDYPRLVSEAMHARRALERLRTRRQGSG